MAATVHERNNCVHLTAQPSSQHFYSYLAWENSQHFATPPATGFPAEWRLRNERRHSILMTHHYQDLGSASDWPEISLNPNQKHYPWNGYEISVLVSQTSFRGEPVVGSPNVRWFLRLMHLANFRPVKNSCISVSRSRNHLGAIFVKLEKWFR